jgi:drug/metabolite transporter (DMT)-like permease
MDRAARKIELESVLLGVVGVIGFSGSVPAMRAAAPELGPVIVGLGRALVAAALAAVLLAVRREKPPPLRFWPGLALVAAGVVIGFPYLASLALLQVPAVHGSVVVGLAPAITAAIAAVRVRERMPRAFWVAVACGIVSVLVFAAAEGAGRPRAADGWLLLGVLLLSIGYAEGGLLARSLRGWRVICWALILSAPFLVAPVAIEISRRGLHASARAWAGFAYASVFSMFLCFFAWYRSLELGGIARGSQLQLAQPVLSMLWAVLLLGEALEPAAVLAGLLVIGSAAVGRGLRTASASPGVA